MSFDRKMFEKLMSGGSAIAATIAAAIAGNVLFTNINDKPIRKHDDNLNKIVQRIQRARFL